MSVMPLMGSVGDAYDNWPRASSPRASKVHQRRVFKTQAEARIGVFEWLDGFVRQQNLSRWLEEARSLPLAASDNLSVREWIVEQKARVLAEASKLSGE